MSDDYTFIKTKTNQNRIYLCKMINYKIFYITAIVFTPIQT